ncbi:hypothetical protein GF386_02900 [Candidatus Pacearchaeota archaeon]|nr:hypothetical protein [Candidatus Pacearchaeota archaeon]MBD3283097.1 hypothetical protein [Candidatus Pacearchaeota archaeon]
MNFTPNRWKILLTLTIIIIWYVVLIGYFTLQCNSENDCETFCNKNTFELIPNHCGNFCDCTTNDYLISKFFYDLTIILLPGVVFYTVCSLALFKKTSISKKP